MFRRAGVRLPLPMMARLSRRAVAVLVVLGLTLASSSFSTPARANGESWESFAAAENNENNQWTSVAYGDGVWVAVAASGGDRVMTSTDGVTWSYSGSEPRVGVGAINSNWQSVAYGSDSDGNGVWVAVASWAYNSVDFVMRSTDGGQNWTSVGSTETRWDALQSVAYGTDSEGNGLWVAVSSQLDRLFTSPDGENWTSSKAPVFAGWQSVAYGNGTWVAVADSAPASGNRVMRSTDGGETWAGVAAAEDNNWQSVAYGSDSEGNGLWVAVASSDSMFYSNEGTNLVMTSQDGESWTAVAAAEDNNWQSVAYGSDSEGNGLWVAVATSDSRLYSPNEGTNLVMTSRDGESWTAVAAAEDNGWRSVAYGSDSNGRGAWVAVADSAPDSGNRVMRSLDPLAPPTNSTAGRNDDDDDDRVAAVVTPAPAVTAPVRPRVAQAAPAPTAAVEGPVLRGGVVSAPPRVPTVLVGGVPTIVDESSPDPTTLSVVAGSLSLGVSVDEGSGGVSRSDDGVNRLSVKSGSAAVLQGSGLQPGASVQVFIPLGVDDSRELASITVAADGTFSGELPVSTDPLAEPLPIGERLLQLVSVDADGNQVVLEMAVNVAQGDPTPALDREAGDIPAVEPGATAVTSAGVVAEATTTVLPDQGLTVIEGDTWNMTVAAESEPGAPVRLVLGEPTGVSGAGFLAGTRADVWLFSEPALLGTVTIDENGEFSGEVGIDPDLIPTGEHTLQIQGVGTDGYVKAVNLGVVMEQTVSQPAEVTTQSTTGLLWWVLGLFLVALFVVVFFLIARSRSRQSA